MDILSANLQLRDYSFVELVKCSEPPHHTTRSSHATCQKYMKSKDENDIWATPINGSKVKVIQTNTVWKQFDG